MIHNKNFLLNCLLSKRHLNFLRRGKKDQKSLSSINYNTMSLRMYGSSLTSLPTCWNKSSLEPPVECITEKILHRFKLRIMRIFPKDNQCPWPPIPIYGSATKHFSDSLFLKNSERKGKRGIKKYIKHHARTEYNCRT